MEYYIPEPPKEFFLNQNPEEAVIHENLTTYLIERFEINNGILVYYKDIPYPRRGFPTGKAVSAVNITKRLFVQIIKIFSRKEMFMSWILFILLPRRIERLSTLLDSFNQAGYKIVSPYILKPQLMTPLASELQGIIYAILARIGIDKRVSKEFSQIFGAMIEYDNAYRYRLEDIFTETSQDALMQNPRKELKRLLKLFKEREVIQEVSDKFNNLYKLISILLLLPKVKDAFYKAILNSDFERLQLDKIDRYWCSLRSDYKFFGKTYQERSKDIKRPMGYTIKI